MTFPVGDLVHETSISNGTGALTLAAVNGKRRASTAYGTTDLGAALNPVFYISSRDAAEWEICPGYMSGANTLVRQTPLLSSNANAPVNFTTGTKDVTSDVPAAKQAWLPYSNFAGNVVSLGKNAGTNPLVRFDFSAGSVATGIEFVGAAAGGGVTLGAISPSADEQLVLRGKGSGGVGLLGTVQITGGSLVVYNPTGGVGSAQVIAQGRDGGYGAGISFRSALNLRDILGNVISPLVVGTEMGNITADGDGGWVGSDGSSQTASLRFRAARNGVVLEFARVSSAADGTIWVGAANLQIGLQSSWMGYSSTYKALRVGNSSAQVIAIGIDPQSCAGGSFNYGQIMIGNGSIIAPNAAGTEFMGVIRAFGGQVYVGGAMQSGEMIGTGLVVDGSGIRMPGYPAGYAKFDASGWLSSDTALASLSSGIFAVTATAIANVTATSASNCQWTRNGNVVTVSGQFDLDVGTLAVAQMDLSIPVASDFTASADLCGVAFAVGIPGQGSPIFAEVTNNKARVYVMPVNPGGDANLTWTYVYQYRVR